MFDIEPRLFSIGTIVVPTLIKLEQPINLTLSTSLNLVKHVFVLLVLSNIHVEPIFVLRVQITIPRDVFK
jgi:hypothetical protein